MTRGRPPTNWNKIDFSEGCGVYFLYAERWGYVREQRIAGSEPEARVVRGLMKKRYPLHTIRVYAYFGMGEIKE